MWLTELTESGEPPNQANGTLSLQIAIQLIRQPDIKELTIADSMWLKGPSTLQCQGQDFFSLVNPDEDKELKLNALKRIVSNKEDIGSERFTRFSSWPKLATAIANLNKMATKYKKESSTKNPLTFCKEADLFMLRTI